MLHLIVQNSLRGSSTAFFGKLSTKLVIEKNYKSRDYKEKIFNLPNYYAKTYAKLSELTGRKNIIHCNTLKDICNIF